MLLARALSYHAFAQHAAAAATAAATLSPHPHPHPHPLPSPSAPPLLMCICSGENKNWDENAVQRLIRYLERLKEAACAREEARAAECRPTGRVSPDADN